MQRNLKSLVFIDWLTITVLDCRIEECLGLFELNEAKKYNSKIVAFSNEEMRARQVNAHDIAVILDGSKVKNNLVEKITKILNFFEDWEIVVSRLDLAHYDYSFFSAIFEDSTKVDIHSRSKKTIFYKADGVGIETLNLGVRGKSTNLRIYNKWAEVQAKNSIPRLPIIPQTYNVEIELHADSLRRWGLRSPYILLAKIKKDRLFFNEVFRWEVGNKLYLFPFGIERDRKTKLAEYNIRQYQDFLDIFQGEAQKKTLSKKAILEKAECEHIEYLFNRASSYIHSKNLEKATIKRFIQELADDFYIDDVIVPIFKQDESYKMFQLGYKKRKAKEEYESIRRNLGR